MLNNKGIYYAKLIIRDIDELKDELISQNVIKISDLGCNSNLADISKTVSTVFSGDDTGVAFLMIGFSEKIYEKFYNMGSVNLEDKYLNDAYTYFKELKTVYESNSASKSYSYFRKYMVRAMDARSSLVGALKRAESLRDSTKELPNVQSGCSYSFDTNVDNIIPCFSLRSGDFTKVGLKLPNEENEYIQIETNEVFRERASSNSTTTSVVVNIVYKDEKEKNSKIYPVYSTFDGRIFRMIKMINGTEFAEILESQYKAEVKPSLIDVEPFYKKANDVWRQSLQPVNYIATGKNHIHPVGRLECTNSWPAAVLKAKTTNDLANIMFFTDRALNQAITRKNRRVSDAVSDAD